MDGGVREQVVGGDLVDEAEGRVSGEGGGVGAGAWEFGRGSGGGGGGGGAEGRAKRGGEELLFFLEIPGARVERLGAEFEPRREEFVRREADDGVG